MGISWSSALQNHSDIVRSQVGFLSLLCLLGLGKVEHLLLYYFGSGLSGNSSFLFFLDRIQRNCCFSPLTALTLHQDLKNLLVPRKENWHLRLALLSTSLTAPWHHWAHPASNFYDTFLKGPFSQDILQGQIDPMGRCLSLLWVSITPFNLESSDQIGFHLHDEFHILKVARMVQGKFHKGPLCVLACLGFAYTKMHDVRLKKPQNAKHLWPWYSTRLQRHKQSWLRWSESDMLTWSYHIFHIHFNTHDVPNWPIVFFVGYVPSKKSNKVVSLVPAFCFIFSLTFSICGSVRRCATLTVTGVIDWV